MLKGIIIVVYLAVGVIVAATHHYFAHLGNVEHIVSAILAVVLWPLVLLGVNLHIGGKAGAKGGKGGGGGK